MSDFIAVDEARAPMRSLGCHMRVNVRWGSTVKLFESPNALKGELGGNERYDTELPLLSLLEEDAEDEREEEEEEEELLLPCKRGSNCAKGSACHASIGFVSMPTMAARSR